MPFPTWKYEPDGQGKVLSEFTGPIDNQLRIYFQMAPGTDEAAATGMYVGEWYYDSNNYIRLYFTGNDSLSLAWKDSVGTERTGAWNCASALAHDGTTYEVLIDLDKTRGRLFVDNALKITVTNDVQFNHNNAPYYWVLGSDISATAGTVYTSTTYTKPNMSTYDFGDALLEDDI